MILFKKKIENCQNTLGAGKGIFGSPKKVDKFIRKQRKEWGLKEKLEAQS